MTRRVLGVLAAFRAERPELGLTELSRRSGLPLTTTHRLVGELADWAGTGAFAVSELGTGSGVLH